MFYLLITYWENLLYQYCRIREYNANCPKHNNVFLAMYSALRQGEGKLVLYFATYGADLTFDRDNTCCCTGGWLIFRQH